MASNILSLPLGILASHVVPLLNSLDKLAVFRTCQHLMRAVLQSQRPRLSLRAPLTGSFANVTWSLQIACQHSPDVRLHLQGRELDDIAAQSVFQDLFSEAAQELGVAACVVQSVVIEDMALDCLLPPWLSAIFPQLTTLSIQDCQLASTLSVAAQPPPHTAVRSLNLHLASPHDSTQAAALQHHLQAFTALQDLQLGCWPRDNVMAAVGATVGAQLTQLTVASRWCTGAGYGGLVTASSLATFCPTLIHLRMPGHALNDPALAACLSAKHLQHLHCGFLRLESSHVGAACTLDTLSVETTLDIEQLSCLPSEGLHVVEVHATRPHQHSTGPQWHVRLHVGMSDSMRDAALSRVKWVPAANEEGPTRLVLSGASHALIKHMALLAQFTTTASQVIVQLQDIITLHRQLWDALAEAVVQSPVLLRLVLQVEGWCLEYGLWSQLLCGIGGVPVVLCGTEQLWYSHLGELLRGAESARRLTLVTRGRDVDEGLKTEWGQLAEAKGVRLRWETEEEQQSTGDV